MMWSVKSLILNIANRQSVKSLILICIESDEVSEVSDYDITETGYGQ
jgi:hypothetical protein